ncbi:MAG: hypothetical protein AAGG81_02240 [Chlamydiota bacterium]
MHHYSLTSIGIGQGALYGFIAGATVSTATHLAIHNSYTARDFVLHRLLHSRGGSGPAQIGGALADGITITLAPPLCGAVLGIAVGLFSSLIQQKT